MAQPLSRLLSRAILLCISLLLCAAGGQQPANRTAPTKRDPSPLQNQTQLSPQSLPSTWVDKDTGHRVFRLTDEANSSALYFNFDAYTPDGREMVYSSPAGIHLLDLATRHTRLLVPAAAGKGSASNEQPTAASRVLAVGRKTGAVYFSRVSPAGLSVIYSADHSTGAVRQLVTLPPHATVVTINADETLASGTYVEGDRAAEEYGSNRAPSSAAPGREAQCQTAIRPVRSFSPTARDR